MCVCVYSEGWCTQEPLLEQQQEVVYWSITEGVAEQATPISRKGSGKGHVASRLVYSMDDILQSLERSQIGFSGNLTGTIWGA